MPTVIDSLLVKLGFESSGFDAGRKKVDKGLQETGKHADETGKKLGKAGADGSKGFDTAAKSALKFLAILGGTTALKHFIDQQIESSAALDRFSRNLGEGADRVAAYGNAAEVAGGSVSGLQSTLDMLSKEQTKLMLTGESGLIPYLSALGVSMTDAYGAARPVTDLLTDIGQALMTKGGSRANAFNMGQAMGIDAGTLNLILKGRSEVDALLKKQKEYGDVMKKLAPEGSKLNRMMTESKQSFQLFGTELMLRAVPYLEKLFDVLATMGAWMRENSGFIEAFLAIIAGGLLAIGASMVLIDPVIVGLLALAAAIALVYDDYQTFKSGGASLIPWKDWKPGIDAAVTGIKWLGEVTKDTFYRMFAAADAVKSVFAGDWGRAKFAIGEFLHGNSGPLSANAGGTAEAPAPAPARSASGKIGGRPDERMKALEAQYGLPSGLLDSVWNAESGRGKNMRSKVGAKGHFQFMDATAKQYGLADPDNFDQSAEAAAKYYRDLLAHYGGDVNKAVAAYNWGQGNVDRKGLGAAPAETRGYLSKVLGGIPGASQAASGAGAAQVAQSNTVNNQRGGDRSIETSIGEIKVYTAATDAAGIARDIGKSTDYLYTSQANYGTF